MAGAALNRLQTARLELVQLDLPALDAWISGNAHELRSRTGARFSEPVDAPPLFNEDLRRIRQIVWEGRDPGPWLFVHRGTEEPVGAGGVGAFSKGTLLLGYAIWPQHQRRGYASEAAAALCDYGLSLPGVLRIRALVPLGHVASERVLTRTGFTAIGEDLDADVGRVGVYERQR